MIQRFFALTGISGSVFLYHTGSFFLLQTLILVNFLKQNFRAQYQIIIFCKHWDRTQQLSLTILNRKIIFNFKERKLHCYCFVVLFSVKLKGRGVVIYLLLLLIAVAYTLFIMYCERYKYLSILELNSDRSFRLFLC